MSQPIILSSYDGGRHNADLDKTISRLDREAMWRDVSTVIVTPAISSPKMATHAASQLDSSIGTSEEGKQIRECLVCYGLHHCVH